jgi:hypothetical protein
MLGQGGMELSPLLTVLQTPYRRTNQIYMNIARLAVLLLANEEL